MRAPAGDGCGTPSTGGVGRDGVAARVGSDAGPGWRGGAVGPTVDWDPTASDETRSVGSEGEGVRGGCVAVAGVMAGVGVVACRDAVVVAAG